jgi:hypothetical protein
MVKISTNDCKLYMKIVLNIINIFNSNHEILQQLLQSLIWNERACFFIKLIILCFFQSLIRHFIDAHKTNLLNLEPYCQSN